jgi:hypothetical protein
MEKERIISLNYDDNFAKVLSFVQFKSNCGDYLHKNNILDQYLIGNNADYISLNGDMITYMPGEKLQECLASGEDPWTSKRRGSTRFGRIVLKIFKSGVFDSMDIERFANSIKWYHTMEQLETKIIEGPEIIKWYDFDSYSDRVGSLGNSCMKYKECRNFFGLYVDNPEIVKMILLKTKDDKIVGRALLWYGENFKFMDRIYVNYDHHFSHFTDWAKDNGYICKQKQSWNSTTFVKENGEDVEMELSIQFKKWRYDYYPYLDTFKWLNLKTGVATNYKPETKDNTITISSGGGQHTNYDHLKMDDFTRLYWNRDNMVQMKYLDNKYSYIENTVYSECMGFSILTKDSKWDDEASDYIFNEEYNELNNWIAINERKDRNKLGGMDWKTMEMEVKKSRRGIIYGTSTSSLFGYQPSFGSTQRVWDEAQGTNEPSNENGDNNQSQPQSQSTGRSTRRRASIRPVDLPTEDFNLDSVVDDWGGVTITSTPNWNNVVFDSINFETVPEPDAPISDPIDRALDEAMLLTLSQPAGTLSQGIEPVPENVYVRRHSTRSQERDTRLREILVRYGTSNDTAFVTAVQRMIDENARLSNIQNPPDEFEF